MNQELEKKPFDDFSERNGERKMNIWKPEPDSEKNKFTFKEIVINTSIVSGVILGIIIMIVALAGTVFMIIFALKALIRVLSS